MDVSGNNTRRHAIPGVVSLRIALRARADELVGRTVRCVAIALPVGGLVATAAGVGTAWLYDFTTRVSTTIPVVLAVLLVLAATFALARLWARRVSAT
ncbi:hypothetical protein A3K89_06130 [Rhodococcoides kyotonense]|uniref:Uncharacterized protein n=1 Tax=Rhodococcoides kyotonense TaxID=398843 RepID=A0A177YAC9_9NOCA|nr:hypothetical protein A3K89_06130 [Rhodococcus kyotonensis]